MTASPAVDQIWETKEGLPGDTAGIQIRITKVTTVDTAKESTPYVDFVYVTDQYATGYGMPVSRLLREFVLSPGPELNRDDDLTIVLGSSTVSGEIDDLDYNIDAAGNRVGPIRSVAFYGIPGWFRINGSHAWEITKHKPVSDAEPVYVPRTVYEDEVGTRFWAINSPHGVMFIDEFGDTEDPAYVTEPRALTLVGPVDSQIRRWLATEIELALGQCGAGADGMHAAADAALAFLEIEVTE